MGLCHNCFLIRDSVSLYIQPAHALPRESSGLYYKDKGHYPYPVPPVSVHFLNNSSPRKRLAGLDQNYVRHQKPHHVIKTADISGRTISYIRIPASPEVRPSCKTTPYNIKNVTPCQVQLHLAAGGLRECASAFGGEERGWEEPC